VVSIKPFWGFQTTLFIANILNFKYGISSNPVIPAQTGAGMTATNKLRIENKVI